MKFHNCLHASTGILWKTFGKISNAMVEIRNWLNMHPTEIVVIYFGNMEGNKTEGHKKLKVT